MAKQCEALGHSWCCSWTTIGQLAHFQQVTWSAKGRHKKKLFFFSEKLWNSETPPPPLSNSEAPVFSDKEISELARPPPLLAKNSEIFSVFSWWNPYGLDETPPFGKNIQNPQFFYDNALLEWVKPFPLLKKKSKISVWRCISGVSTEIKSIIVQGLALHIAGTSFNFDFTLSHQWQRLGRLAPCSPSGPHFPFGGGCPDDPRGGRWPLPPAGQCVWPAHCPAS